MLCHINLPNNPTQYPIHPPTPNHPTNNKNITQPPTHIYKHLHLIFTNFTHILKPNRFLLLLINN